MSLAERIAKSGSLIETKGRIFDSEQVKAKDAAIKVWCKRIRAETNTLWDYVSIHQTTFDGNPCTSFADLVKVTEGGLLV